MSDNTPEQDEEEERELVLDKFAEIVARQSLKWSSGKDVIARALSVRKTLSAMVLEYLSVGAGKSNMDGKQ